MFFDVSDGIFLNYCWTSEDLQLSRENAVKAGRPFDVYVGIDVYGRGCLGGGGFNTSVALEMVRKYDLSAAIFGQGWTHEKLGEKDFTSNEIKFWQLIDHLCPTRSISCLPLVTSFCQGFGEAFFVRGKTAGTQPWYNQSLSQVQPSFTMAQFPESVRVAGTQLMDACTEDAYMGGTSLCLVADLRNNNHLEYRLFDFNIDLENYPSLEVSYTYKLLADHDCDLYLSLKLESGNQSTKLVLGSVDLNEARVPVQQEVINNVFVMPPTIIKPVSVETAAEDKRQKQDADSKAEDRGKRWITRCYQIPSQYMQHKLRQLSVCVYTATKVDERYTDILLGQIVVWPGKKDRFDPTSMTLKFVEIDPKPPQTAIIEKGEATQSKADDTTQDAADEPPAASDSYGTGIQIAGEIDQSEGDNNQEDQWGIPPSSTDRTPIALDLAQLQKYHLHRSRLLLGSNVRKSQGECLQSRGCFQNSFTIHWSDVHQQEVQYYNIFARSVEGANPVLLGQSIHPSFKVCRNGLVQMSKCSSAVKEGKSVGELQMDTKESQHLSNEKPSAMMSAPALHIQVLVQPVLNTGSVPGLETCPNFNVTLESL